MRILVTFAVDAEFAPWRKLREFVVKDGSSQQFFSAQFGATEVNVMLTGIGCKSAWLETTKQVWNGDVDVCISSGLAGALRPQYRPADVLVARMVQATGSRRIMESDPELMALAASMGASVVGSFYSADHVLANAAEKRELGSVADAVEMESAEVLFEASAFGARVVAVRGISDGLEEDLPLDFNRVVTPSGEVSMTRVLSQVVRRPSSVPALMRFGQQSRMAARKLCDFLDIYVENVARKLSRASTGALIT